MRPLQGLETRRHGEVLESVGSRAGSLDLLTTGEMELAEGTLRAGEVIHLIPDVGRTSPATEVYYLLAGRLQRLGGEDDAEPLGKGDYLVARGLEQEVIYSALEEVRFLYVTSRPFFHEISAKLQELMRLAVEVELKDGYTAEHCNRLMQLSFATGREVGLDSHRLRLLSRGAYLHDVGKVKVPEEILRKPAALSKQEWAVIRKHPTFGREMLEPTFVREAGPIVEQHHERLDGSGYPYGLAGDEILPEAYIVAIADTYDAMTTDRTYRKALSVKVAEDELRRFADIHYPGDLVETFLATVNRVEAPGAAPIDL